MELEIFSSFIGRSEQWAPPPTSTYMCGAGETDGPRVEAGGPGERLLLQHQVATLQVSAGHAMSEYTESAHTGTMGARHCKIYVTFESRLSALSLKDF